MHANGAIMTDHFRSKLSYEGFFASDAGNVGALVGARVAFNASGGRALSLSLSLSRCVCVCVCMIVFVCVCVCVCVCRMAELLMNDYTRCASAVCLCGSACGYVPLCVRVAVHVAVCSCPSPCASLPLTAALGLQQGLDRREGGAAEQRHRPRRLAERGDHRRLLIRS